MAVTITSSNGIALNTDKIILNILMKFCFIDCQNVYPKIIHEGTDRVNVKKKAIHIQRRDLYAFPMTKT